MLTRRRWLKTAAAACASGSLLAGSLAGARGALAAATGAAAGSRAAGADRPNILIIMADDATYSDLPLWGGENVLTPHMGLTFNHAYLAVSMCVPCRTELHTGLYPMRNGCCWNHSPAYPGTRSTPHFLNPLGYRVGIAGKVHVNPRRCFPFEYVPGVEGNCVSPTAKFDRAPLREFMARNKKQPFCLTVALVVPHVVWTVGDPSHFKPKELKLPGYMVDTPQMRSDFARYLAEIEVLDQQVGGVLKALDEAGQADRTLVLFTTEQGAQIPACKWTNYDQGIHTGLVARWPGRIQPGRRTDAMVQYADILPTLLEAAGADPTQEDFDGSSFLPVLLGRKNEHRQYAYFMHNNVPEGPPYPIRSVRDRRYHYIRNLRPDELYIEKHVMGRYEHNPYWLTWMFATESDPHAYAMVRRYMRRPAEELYDTQADPQELNNLAGRPEVAEIQARLSAELDRWMRQQKDPGADLDTHEVWKQRRQEAATYQKTGQMPGR